MRNARKKLLLLGASLTIVVGLAECAFRVYLGFKYEAVLKKHDEDPSDFVRVVRDDPIQFVLIPNHKCVRAIPAGDSWPAGAWTFTVTDGFRGGLDVDFDSDERRVLIIGDSFSFGSAVEDHETLPVQLERQLNGKDSKRRTRVVNGGVPGTNSVQHLEMLKRAFDRVRPHLVLLVYVVNDAEPLHHVPNPPAYVYRHYYLWTLAEARDVFNRLTGTKTFDVTKPVSTQDFLKGFEPDSHLWRESKQALGQMHAWCAAKGCPFAVFTYPSVLRPMNRDYDYVLIHESVEQWGEGDGYRVVDLLPAFFGRDNRKLLVPGDGHPNAEAHGIAAGVMADYIRSVLE